jgi:hypothetical protein
MMERMAIGWKNTGSQGVGILESGGTTAGGEAALLPGSI